MKKLTPIEWQSFSLKKDIENIEKKLQDNRVTQLSLTGQIFVVILGAALSKIFANIVDYKTFWISLLVISFIVLSIPFIKRCKEKLKNNEPGSDRMEPREFINTFDNEISYFILMSESYCTMLTEALSYNDIHADKKITKDMLHFYYIQASYYFKKTIDDLIPINNIVDKVLSSDIKEIAEKKLISYPRYFNAINLLVAIYEYLEKHKSVVKDLDNDDVISGLNEYFKDLLDCINRVVNKKCRRSQT